MSWVKQALAVGLALLVFGTSNLTMAQETSVPAPIIVIVDTKQILKDSTAAQSILRQVDALNRQLQTEATEQDKRLGRERQELEKQRSVLTPEAFQQRVRSFEDNLRDVQREMQEKSQQIQLSTKVANVELQNGLAPILKDLMSEKGANLLFEKSRVAFHSPQMDITGEALSRLNAEIPDILMIYPPGAQ